MDCMQIKSIRVLFKISPTNHCLGKKEVLSREMGVQTSDTNNFKMKMQYLRIITLIYSTSPALDFS